MLRLIFVVIIIITGLIASFYGSFYAYIFYLWIAYFRPESWIWSGFLKGQNLSLYVGIFIILSMVLTRKNFKINTFSILLLIFLLHSFISAILSSHSDICMKYWVDLLKVIVITYISTNLIVSEKDMKIVLIVMTLSLGLEGAKQGWAGLLLSPGNKNDNIIPFLGDNNGVAVGMLMLTAIILSLINISKRKWMKLGWIFLVIGTTYRSLSTYSRGGLLAAIALFIMTWMHSKNKIVTLLLVVLIAGLILPIFPQQFWDRMDTITVSTNEEERDASANSRLYFWKIAFQMAQAHPIFGVGPNGFSSSYNEFDSSHGLYGQSRAVHSMWFGILSELGFVGTILFLSIYIYSLLACIRTRRKCLTIPNMSALANYATSMELGLIAAAIGGTFLSFQYVEMLWHFFGLSIALEALINISISNKTIDDDSFNTASQEFSQQYIK